MKAMEVEHMSEELPDTHTTFTSGNGITTTSAVEVRAALGANSPRSL